MTSFFFALFVGFLGKVITIFQGLPTSRPSMFLAFYPVLMTSVGMYFVVGRELRSWEFPSCFWFRNRKLKEATRFLLIWSTSRKHTNNEKITSCLGYKGDYTNILCGDYNVTITS